MKRLFKLALVAGAVAAAVNMMKAKRAEWEGLTESEARTKLEGKFPDQMPEDKRSEVADKIVGKMKDRGIIRPDLADDVATATPSGSDSTG